MRYAAWMLTSAVVVVGCHASVKGKVNTSGQDNLQGQASVEGQASGDETPAEPSAAPSTPSVPESEQAVAGSVPQALLGARHDLRLAQSQKTAVCSCLAAAVGRPSDAAFAWEAAPPAIDPDTQLVVALSSEGIPCPEQPKDSLGASYWGYRMANGNVIVEVENARFGRPVTSGAIIPRPAEGGHVYVKPTGKSVPYGRPLDNKARYCKLL